VEGFHLVVALALDGENVVSQLAKAPEYMILFTRCLPQSVLYCTVLYCTYSTRYLAKLHCQEFQSRGYNLDQCTESQRYNLVS
jgi:hypothetical protein